MAVRPAGVLRLGRRAFGPSRLVVMAVVAAGAVGDPAAGLAARAVEAGVEPERVVVGADGFAGLAELVATGWPVLVSLSDQDGAGSVAGGGSGGLTAFPSRPAGCC